MKKIRLLIIEDNRLLRDGITEMLKLEQDIIIISIDDSDKTTLANIRKLKPDVILLDLGLRNHNSLTVVEVVKKDFPGAKVIVMDLAPVEADIQLFVKAGASGFILKDATLEELLDTIRTVAIGGKVTPIHLSDSLFSKIVDHALLGGQSKLMEAVRMTKREREVIQHIGDGLSNKEIGGLLGVSPFTIKSHIHNIMEKLALHTRLEVANYSYSPGLKKKFVKTITTVH